MYLVKNPEAFDATPELGMGYHFGVVQGDREEGVIVLNAQFALTPRDIMDPLVFQELSIRLHRHGEHPFAPERRIVPSDDIALFKASFGGMISNMNAYETRAKLHASPAFPLQTKSSERFIRLSAFRNDRRVRPDGSLLPGTYVTSELDADVSPSGFAAVGRYALPNPMPAINCFDIAIPKGTSGLVGTVAPAFGQAGGGVEIELTNATLPGSVTGPRTIPEY